MHVLVRSLLAQQKIIFKNFADHWYSGTEGENIYIRPANYYLLRRYIAQLGVKFYIYGDR